MVKNNGRTVLLFRGFIYLLLWFFLSGCADMVSGNVDDFLSGFGGKATDFDIDGHILLQLDKKGFKAHHEGWVYTLESGIYRMRLDGT